MGIDGWSLTVAIVALVGSFVGWLIGRKDARDARNDASEARRAAIDSAEAAKRSAAAAEEQVALARPPEVDFEVKHVREALFTLINRGQGKVTGVTIEEPGSGLGRDLPVRAILEKGQGVNFLLMGTLQSPIPASIAVRCDQSEVPQFVDVPQ